MLYALVRHFRVVPVNMINFSARSYYEMIDFSNIDKRLITEPPLITHYSNEELNGLQGQKLDILGIPCHSQNVERCFADVTKASLHTRSHDARHANIIATRSHRREVPTNMSKKHFK